MNCSIDRAAPLLGNRTLIRERLLSALSEHYPAKSTDTIFLAGSVAEGYANATSDVDLFVVSDAPADGQFWQIPSLSFEIADTYCDVEFVPRETMSSLLDRLRIWADSEARISEALRFVHREWYVLHRLKTAVFLQNPVDAKELKLLARNLQIYKLSYSINWVMRYHVDILGLISRRDWVSARFMTQSLVASIFDGVLALHGDTSNSPKWRIRRLRELDAAWFEILPAFHSGKSAEQAFADLYFADRISESKQVLEYAHRVIAMSRKFVAAGHMFLASQTVSRPPAHRKTGAPPPKSLLSLDTQVHVVDGKTCLVKLGSQKKKLELSPELTLLALMFDDQTDTEAMHAWIRQIINADPVEFTEEFQNLLKSEDFLTDVTHYAHNPINH